MATVVRFLLLVFVVLVLAISAIAQDNGGDAAAPDVVDQEPPPSEDTDECTISFTVPLESVNKQCAPAELNPETRDLLNNVKEVASSVESRISAVEESLKAAESFPTDLLKTESRISDLERFFIRELLDISRTDAGAAFRRERFDNYTAELDEVRLNIPVLYDQIAELGEKVDQNQKNNEANLKSLEQFARELVGILRADVDEMKIQISDQQMEINRLKGSAIQSLRSQQMTQADILTLRNDIAGLRNADESIKRLTSDAVSRLRVTINNRVRDCQSGSVQSVFWTDDQPSPYPDKQSVIFATPFHKSPTVSVGMDVADIFSGANTRYTVLVQNVTPDGFDIIFNTWGDTHIYKMGVSYIACA